MKLIKAKIVGVVKEDKKYADLRSVMNYTVPFELIYSGVENESYYNVLYDLGIRNFLMSYHYIQNKHINVLTRFSEQKVRLFIDSGAHTYQNDLKYQDTTVEQWEAHLKKYLNWAEKNKDYIFAIANFDFENIVDPETVDRWNRDYFEPFMLKTGIPVCFVWHQNSANTWEFYCKRYPYVGFSSVNTEGVAIDLNEYRERLRVAEKNDALVHGFGMTRTGMLTELPFYTSDSTTWLVGLQYGEINYWRDTKMSRLKKDAWKTTYLDDICSRYGLDRELMLQEDTNELIKANIGAFINAEEFIQTRLVSRMYWLKSKTERVDLDSVEEGFFPSVEWLNSDNNEGAEEFAKKMNINPDYEDLVDLLYDATVFVNWNNPEYAELREWYLEEEQYKLISEMHDIYINRIVPDKEAKIQDLISFFRDCVSGKNDRLLQIGTNFDRIVKERLLYIEEEEEDLVDISEDEVKNRIKNLLPAPSDSEEENAPEIESLDREIFNKANIVPVFDERGKFLKGQTAVKRPKKMYSKKYPKFACDTCYAAQKCPEYKAGYVCAYSKMFERFDTRDIGDVIQAMQGMVSHNLTRMQRAMIMEVIQGTVDPAVTSFIDQNTRLLTILTQLYNSGSPEVMRQTRIVRADGTREETTQVTNPQEGGILEKLFSNMGREEEAPKTESKVRSSRYEEEDE